MEKTPVVNYIQLEPWKQEICKFFSLPDDLKLKDGILQKMANLHWEKMILGHLRS